MSNKILSIVIPAFNERLRLPRTLDSVIAYCQKTFGDGWEVLVVDDGSRDGTSELVRSSYPSVRLITLEKNQGKGNAIITGVSAAKSSLCLFMDADGATSIEEERKLRDGIDKGNAIAIGSRAIGSGKRVWKNPLLGEDTDKEEQVVWRVRPHRHILGRVFAFLVRFFLRLPYEDTQCGFKMFKTAVGQDLFSSCKMRGYTLDIEFLFLAQLRRVEVREIPVNWKEQAGSKIKLWKDPFLMFLQLLWIPVVHISSLLSYKTNGADLINANE